MIRRIRHLASRMAAIVAWMSCAHLATMLPASAQTIRRPAPTTAELAALGLQEQSTMIRSTERWFLVRPPTDPSRSAPVLLVLHGGGQSMRHLFSPTAGATRAWPGLAARENALLLVPNATHWETGSPKSDDQTWNDLRQGVARESKADDVGFLLGLLDWAQSAYRVDASRVYVTGASNGGMMTFRMLMEAPERFAAAAAFVSALPVDETRLKRPKLPTPLLIANGTLDPLIIWNGGKIAGGRGETRSVAATVDWWVAANAASKAPTEITRLPDRAPDDTCTIERRVHNAGAGGAEVLVYAMVGGGHTIPSAKHPLPDNWIVRRFIGPVCRDVEGTELIWEFFAKHRR